MLSFNLVIGIFLIVVAYKAYWVRKSILATSEEEKAFYRGKIISWVTWSMFGLMFLVLWLGSEFNF